MKQDKIKVAHIADCHLRNVHYGSAARGRRFLDGVKSAIREARAHNADVILCAGDLLDSNNPGPAVINWQVTELNEFLCDNELSMLVSVGNHDNCTPSWLTPYECFEESEFMEPGIHLIRDFAVRLDYDTWPVQLDIASCDYCEKQEFIEWCANLAHKQDIIMWHGEIQEFCGFPKACAITVEELPENVCQVLAMGHIHTHKSTQRASDGMVIAYPGSTEMASEEEDEHKMFYMYTFVRGEQGDPELKEIESIPFATQPVIRRTLRTESELEETITYIKEHPDTLAYIRFDKALHEAAHRLHEAADENLTTLRLTPMMPDRFNVHVMSREAVVRGPAVFFDENIEDLIHDAEVRERVAPLTKQLLTPGADSRTAINAYCDARLGNTTL